MNRIKFMNGELFKSMLKLSSVSLSGNVCIDVDFEPPIFLENLMQEVGEKCSNDKPLAPTSTTEIYPDNKKFKALQSKLRQALIKIDDLEAELDDLKLKCEGV
jgi:hypothetical protein